MDLNTAKSGKYALCIGISAYDPPNTLNYCDDDANDWATYLTSKGYTVTKLFDKAATKSIINTAVNNLASKAIVGNAIGLYVSRPQRLFQRQFQHDFG